MTFCIAIVDLLVKVTESKRMHVFLRFEVNSGKEKLGIILMYEVSTNKTSNYGQ